MSRQIVILIILNLRVSVKLQSQELSTHLHATCTLRVCMELNGFGFVRFCKVFAAVTMKNPVFCKVTQCGSCKNGHFGRTQRLHHQGDKNRWTRRRHSSGLVLYNAESVYFSVYPHISAPVKSRGICGGQSGAGAGFLRVFRIPVPIIHSAYCSTMAITIIIIIQLWYKSPVSGLSNYGLGSTPAQQIKKPCEYNYNRRIMGIFRVVILNWDRLCGLVVRVPGC
jgi:hypothetical protein